MSSELAFDRRMDPNRITLRETFLQRPALNAVMAWPTPYAAASAQAIAVANRNFEVSGSNMTTALCTFNAAGGGITLTTAGGGTDEAMLGAHSDTNQSAFKNIEWDTTYEPSFEAKIKLHSDLTQCSLVCGFKLTGTSVVATDNDQAMFAFTNTTAITPWTFVHSRAGTDTTESLDPFHFAKPVVSTIYRLRIDVLSDRTVVASIGVGNGGALKPITSYPLPALTADVNLLPFIGVLESEAEAKAVTVYYVECGRKIA